ncbi:helix-turn-helix transcriptional regulator [Marmoricola sp. RAF53]|uniref:helix-turn-helix transcriptional regulator n=1 Tax=Marmoricola sp. RAF53 TaxID=3233059 RepID=UPI003F97FDEF
MKDKMNHVEHRPDTLLRARVVADLLGTTEGRLANMRCAGVGPTFIKIGHSVRYRVSDIEAYLNANTIKPVTA